MMKNVWTYFAAAWLAIIAGYGFIVFVLALLVLLLIHAFQL